MFKSCVCVRDAYHSHLIIIAINNCVILCNVNDVHVHITQTQAKQIISCRHVSGNNVVCRALEFAYDTYIIAKCQHQANA